MKPKSQHETLELADYYPNPMWLAHRGDWIKNLILFFDGISLLVPHYIKDKPFEQDPAIATGLHHHGLLKILEPETIIDQESAIALAKAMTDIIATGKLDDLASKPSQFHELSWSRLGYMADEKLATGIYDELKKRGLAKPSKDGVSVPIHELVRSLILVLLSQIMKERGKSMGLDLNPTTDRPEIHKALQELLNLPETPSAGQVVASDLEVVSVDLGAVPIDEVLAFRKAHLPEYREYRHRLRDFVRQLSVLSPEERQKARADRMQELKDRASDLRKRSFKLAKTASFGLGIAGATWKALSHDPVGAVIMAAAAFVGASAKAPKQIDAYSYLFNAHAKFS